MQGSQDKLKNVLHDKLQNYEATVTRQTSDAILASVRSARKNTGVIRKAMYSAGLLILAGSVYYFSQLADQSIVARDAAASVSAIANPKIIPKKSPAAIRATDISTSAPQNTNQQILLSGQTSQDNTFTTIDKSTLQVVVVPLPASNNQPLPTTVVNSIDSVELSTEVAASATTVDAQEQLEVRESTESVLSESNNAGRFSISLGIMPTLNYRRLIPNGNDASFVHDFQLPSSLDKSRFGANSSVLVNYSLKKGRSIFAGVGVFTYKTHFTYRSNETSSSIGAVNEVAETSQGVSVHAGLRLPLWPDRLRRYNLNIGGQLQLPKAGAELVAQAGFEYGFNLLKGTLIIQPVMFYSITPVQYNGLIAYPYGGGLDIRYELPLGQREEK